MEKLLQYVWKHKLFPLQALNTTDGSNVEVIDVGLQNSDSGPDFFNAKVKINDTVWVGNVEIHMKSSEWYAHGHDKDATYNNVILHVAEEVNADVVTEAGRSLPQIELKIPEKIYGNYRRLLEEDKYPPCYGIIPQISTFEIHSWMSALLAERLERKTNDILKRVSMCDGSWESAYFMTLARNYGFGINGDAFEMLASKIPLNCAAHQRDNILQIEALFMGQAGLLSDDALQPVYMQDAIDEGYFKKLQNEYSFLANKYNLKPMDREMWKFMRLRPQNFPHIRISQIANLYCSRKADLADIIECSTTDELKDALNTDVTPYWETHYTFGSTSCKTSKSMSPSSLDLLIINTAVPMMFAYGRHRGDEKLCEKALDILDGLKAENNFIVRMWRMCGLLVRCAGDSQALIQLKKEYCDTKKCLKCRIGYEYLKKYEL